ncbi:cellulose 1,4-beta-cellobiosidase [Kribbella voronezhensis]|uniref:Glucanase n=1 Tax=Kribbella voronezhensis TaxID=2512212 RepID=A0A4R7SXG2_9ACTN|nr:glycoside hydrolase family 6 protein [Kribbella voronezhensis]TDU83366.1 cellulose 1,4-beta-cellobiosidase [Kribbella voronezhensis]
MSKIPKRLLAASTAVATALVALPLIAPSASAAEAHVDNPYAGATQYVNPTWAATVEGAATRASDPALAAKMRQVETQPTAVWMDRISAITGNADGNGLRFHLDRALLQKQSGTPLVVNLVIYDLPGRDCYALASNGELPATAAGLARYKSEYIDAIASILADSKYAGLRIAATIEPDSLPNLITNSSQPECQTAAPFYRDGVKYALDKLHAIPNVYNYIDAAHSGWLGWDSNAGPAAKLFADVARTTQAGFASIDGFVTNTANTTPLEEPYLPNSSLTLNGNPIRSAKFYEWNFDFDEIDWTAHLYNLLIAEGFPASTGMLIDTSRNGWGGAARPTATSTSTDLNTYVDQSRVDRRNHRGAWCNPLGAGIGERPRSTPSGYPGSHLDAFVWIKPPGESDGASTDIPNDEGKRFDRMCDPTFVSPKLGNQLTGASPGAPLAGRWFESQFNELVRNAYPAIGGGSSSDQTAPSVPTGLRTTTVGDTSVALAWTASTDNVGVAGYDIYRGTTLAGSSATTSFTATGLTASTAYSFTVRAKDAAGNVSAASTTLAVTTTTGSTTPPGACRVNYSANTWNTGFTGTVKLTNTGSAPLANWRLVFDFANGQTLQQGWNATWSQSGTTVTAAPVVGSWNATIAPGASVDIGFNAAHTGTNNAPTAFAVNGQSCSIG